MRRTYQPALFALLIAVLPAATASAQDLASFEPSTDAVELSTTRITPAASPRTISDDGNDQERVPTTSQLVVAYTGDADITFTLDILNEQGHVVRHQVLDPARNQRFWTVDVEPLRSGRYVARLLCAKGAVINRFRRD